MKTNWMKKISCTLCIILFALCFYSPVGAENVDAKPEEKTTIHILFIGNSSTYYNQMPKIVGGLAEANGIPTEISSITAGNYKLTQFADETNAYHTQIVEILKKEKWDYVVLQDHRESIIQNLSESKEAVMSLKKLIDEAGAQTILYETQADLNGRSFKINDMSVFLDQEQIQYLLNQNYYQLSNQLNVTLSPAGMNYVKCMQVYPEINLYYTDSQHPSIAGSYLAACSLYETIFDDTAYGNEFVPGSELDTNSLLKGLDLEEAQKLQEVADERIKIKKKSQSVIKGFTGEITAERITSEDNPLNAQFSDSVKYISLNDKVLSVNQHNGTFTAINPGETMIMVLSDSGLMALSSVTVTQPATSISIEEASGTKLYRGDKLAYTVSLAPLDSTDNIKWTSSNPSIVSVSNSGEITAKKIGSATITATADSGVKVSRTVYVRLKEVTKVKAKKIKTKQKKKASVKVTWKKNSAAVVYYVYRRVKGKSKYKKIANAYSAKYTDKNRVKGKTYYYKIRAVYSNTKCNSLKSAYAKITVK